MEEIAKLLTDCHNSFKDTESARILSFYRSRDNRLTFDERLQVINEVENTYSPVYMELKHLNPALTDWDCMLCVLSYEGFPVAVISIQSTMRYKILMTFVYILSVVSIVSLWYVRL